LRRAPATAKLNLALVVGPSRPDGLHEVATVIQRVDLADRVAVGRGEGLTVTGFAGDTLVRGAIERFAAAAGIAPGFEVRIEKRIPVAAGLGGGSSDAATALRLANDAVERPLPPERLEEIAGELGADVPSFLRPGPQLGVGDGRDLSPLELPQDYWVVLVLPHGERKRSSAAVYAALDARGDGEGFDERRRALAEALARVRRPRDLAALPPNDLASSPVADELRALGAFRADVTGAGPVVYGLFHHREPAAAARDRIGRLGRTWLTVPTWYF
jgi:4-diphosphocytidyl-2-C-methyl-D-erythritol kinase